MIPADRVDAMDVVFVLPGVAGSDRVLVEGDTHDAYGRTGNRVIPVISRLASGDDTLCSEARTEDFQVTSLTPETCAVGEPFCRNSAPNLVLPPGDMLTRSADVIADGVCAVRVEAPAFAGGAGLGAEVSVTLLNTHQMYDVTP
ncbi:hypothetical protein [Sorangium sp. So ce1389]|uniref:hypothetical protein n=1 Tax=Sorangium sp. So ce1389 TaxID=3133336 RepID=UPI003F600271